MSSQRPAFFHKLSHRPLDKADKINIAMEITIPIIIFFAGLLVTFLLWQRNKRKKERARLAAARRAAAENSNTDVELEQVQYVDNERESIEYARRNNWDA